MPEAEPDDVGTGDRRSGEVDLSGRTWEFDAVPTPLDEEEPAGEPFLRWYEVTFRRADDPEQEAVARAGVPAGDWSGETLRSVLRSARTRTWRGPGGELWTVRLEGWSGSGISTEVDDADAAERAVVFSRGNGDGDEIRRSAPEMASITAADDGELAQLLEGGSGAPADET